MDERVAPAGEFVLDRAEAFSGRSRELAWVVSMLARPEELPAVLSVHGPPGIGKTAFVYALAAACGDRSLASVSIIDSMDFEHSVDGFEGIVEAASGDWSDDRMPLLLVFDTYEEMGDVVDLLWDRLLPSLRGPVLVVLSGRLPARAAARGARGLPPVRWLELPRLSASESRQLVARFEVQDEGAAAQIVEAGAGNPLLLSVACETYRSGLDHLGDIGWLLAAANRALISRMTREVRDPAIRRLLDAAAIVRTFDADLLAAMDVDSSHDGFDALSKLSFVRWTPHGARLHDLVRQSIETELRWRSPVTYSELQRRAASHLCSRAAGGSRDRHEVEELLHLIGSSVGSRSMFADSDDRLVRAARREDLPALEHLCHVGRHEKEMGRAQLLRELRADFPNVMEWFVLVFDADDLIGYGYSFPLHAGTWRAAASARQGWFRRLDAAELSAMQRASPGSPPAFLIAGVVMLPDRTDVESVIRTRAFVNRFTRAPNVRRSYMLLPANSSYGRMVEEIGGRRRLREIELAPGERAVDEWVLDYGEAGLTTWVERTFSLRPLPRRLQLVDDRALVDQVKLALTDLYRLEVLARSPLTALFGRGTELTPNELQAQLIRLVDELAAADSPRAREAGELLLLYYVKRVGSHEVVAERLGLPRTTFYRRLRHGLELLARRAKVEDALHHDDIRTPQLTR